VVEPPRDDEPGSDPQGAWGGGKALEVLALAFVFPLTVYVGFLAGRWVGGRLGDATTGALVGGVLGAVAGFWELYGFTRRLRPR
jgi:positive regulator of sigma E activity